MAIHVFSCTAGKGLLQKNAGNQEQRFSFLPKNCLLVIHSGKYQTPMHINSDVILNLINQQNLSFNQRMLPATLSSQTYKMFVKSDNNSLVGFKHHVEKPEILVARSEEIFSVFRQEIIRWIDDFEGYLRENNLLSLPDTDGFESERKKILTDDEYAKKLIANYLNDEFFDYCGRRLLPRLQSFLAQECLLNLGFDINRQNIGKPGYLEVAFSDGNVGVARVLLEHGVDISKPNPNAFSYIYRNYTKNNGKEMMDLLIRNRGDSTLFDDFLKAIIKSVCSA
jgi:hypothetical protein